MNFRSFTARAIRAAVPVGVAIVACLAPASLAQTSGPVDADRVTVKLTGDQFELVSVTPLSTVLPASDGQPGSLGSVSGFWYELQTEAGEATYRRITGDPVRLVFEGPEVVQMEKRSAPAEIRLNAVRSREAERSVFSGPVAGMRSVATKRSAMSTRMKTMEVPSRSEAVPEVRVFSVLVPRAQDGDALVLFGAPLAVGNEAEAAGELARLPLTVAPVPEVGHE